MRKLERQMNFAVSNKGNWAGSNTSVSFNSKQIAAVSIYTVIKLQPLTITSKQSNCLPVGMKQ